MSSSFLWLVGIGLLSMGCGSDAYARAVHSELAAIRASRDRDRVSDDGLRVSEAACNLESKFDDSSAILTRCATARSTLAEFAAIRRELESESTPLAFVESARKLATLAERRARINERAWVAAVDLQSRPGRERTRYDADHALELVTELARAAHVDAVLMDRAVSLLGIARSGPPSYRAVANEVYVAMELSVTPQGALKDYQRALGALQQRMQSAAAVAEADPEATSESIVVAIPAPVEESAAQPQ